MPAVNLSTTSRGLFIEQDASGELRIYGRKEDGSVGASPVLNFRDQGNGIEVIRGLSPGDMFKLAADGGIHVVGLTP